MLPATHIEALTEAGFVAVSSDYRLGPTISVLEGPVADSVAAYEWAQNELPTLLESEHGIRVNGKNIVTLGHSCGGGLALLMVRIKHVRPGPSVDVSYTSRHLALTRPRPSLIYSDSNTCATVSITLGSAPYLRQVHPLHQLLSSSSKSSMRFLPQPLHLLLSVPAGRT
jgi:fermentation-respiration switch protein FrsA (DUF1100 family)